MRVPKIENVGAINLDEITNLTKNQKSVFYKELRTEIPLCMLKEVQNWTNNEPYLRSISISTIQGYAVHIWPQLFKVRRTHLSCELYGRENYYTLG